MSKAQQPMHTAVPAGLKDGQIAIPGDYRSWPVYLESIDKPGSAQVRDIYINPVGNEVERGQSFPTGTISVMEIWKAQVDAKGKPVMTSEGRLIKDEVSLVFAMAKSKGAGTRVPAELRNGDWVYAGFGPDARTPAGPPAAACRTCHLKASSTDWVFRVDEYLDNRASMTR